LAQGREQTKLYIQENVDLQKKLLEKIREKLDGTTAADAEEK
jgi:hypothetical protein